MGARRGSLALLILIISCGYTVADDKYLPSQQVKESLSLKPTDSSIMLTNTSTTLAAVTTATTTTATTTLIVSSASTSTEIPMSMSTPTTMQTPTSTSITARSSPSTFTEKNGIRNMTDISPSNDENYIFKIKRIRDTIITSWQAIPGIETYRVLEEHYTLNTNKIISSSFSGTKELSYTLNTVERCVKVRIAVSDALMPNVTIYNGTITVNREVGPLLSIKVRRIECFKGMTKLLVSWTPPENSIGCPLQYNLKLLKENALISKVNTTQNSYSFDIPKFDHCTTYTFKIILYKEGKMLEERTENTRFSYSIDPPSILNNQKWSSANNITITWNTSITYTCPSEKLQIKTICNVQKSYGHGYELKNGSVVNNISKGLNIVNATITNLSPFTKYQCYAKIVVEDKEQTKSNDVIEVITREEISKYTSKSKPPTVAMKQDQLFELKWEQPDYLAGNITGYEAVVTWKPLYREPKSEKCQRNHTDIYKIEGNKNSTSLKYYFYANHSVQIRANTGLGWSNYGKFVNFTMPFAKPGKVNGLIMDITMNQNDLRPKAVLRWALPCEINGILEYFNIFVNGTLEKNHHTFNVSVGVRENGNEDDTYSYDFGEQLISDYNYIFEVAAKVKNVEALGPVDVYNFGIFPAGIPKKLIENDLIHLDPEKGKRTQNSAEIMLPLFEDSNNGRIINYTIIVAEKGHNPEKQGKLPYESLCTWRESKAKDFREPYQATDEYWDYKKQEMSVIGNLTYIRFNVGGDESCKEISMRRYYKHYCNGPLQSNTWYDVRIRAFTKGGYADSPVFVIKTKTSYNMSVIVGSIFGIILFGTVTTLALLMRNKNVPGVLQRFLHSSMRGSPVPTPFTRKKFIAHCQQLADNPGKLSNEFQLLQTLSMDLQMPTNTACLQANRKKNRYSDILPYDFYRVKLKTIDNDPNSDYINASFIKGVTNEDEYIACQGPKEETVYDFWRMIDEYDVKIIVMLTEIIETGKEKCHQYFPIIRETFKYENMSIRCTSELDYRTCIQRNLVLEKRDSKRYVTHLQFKNWPDHDVPEDFDPVINFCQMVRKHITANKGLAVVHCSAGIGRTGTLIAIDILLQQIKDNKKIDVFGTVYRLRRHRINMVQRESQYAYIYNCVRQVLKNPYFLKSYKPPPVQESLDSNASKPLELPATELETVLCKKMTNISTSADSTVPLYNSTLSTPVIVQNDTHLHALRSCKSTSAINSKISSIAKFGSFNFPNFDMDHPLISRENVEINLQGSTDSLYENVIPLIRSKSAHVISNPQNVTHDWLERDTPV